MTNIEVQKTKLVHQWAHDAPIIACRLSPKGDYCVSTSQDNNLQRWVVSTGEKLALVGHDSWVHALTFAQEGQLLISGGCDGKLIWWSISETTPSVVRAIDAHAGWIRAVELSPDGSSLVSVGNDRVIRLWNVATGEKLSEWSAHDRHIYTAAFHPDGQHLATGDLLGKIHLWKLADHSLVKSLDGSPLYAQNAGQGAEFGGIRTLAFNKSGSELSAGGTHKASNPYGAVHEPLMLRFKLEDTSLLKTHACDGIPGGLVFRAQYVTEDICLGVSGGSSGGLLLYFSGAQEKEIHRFTLPSLARDMDLQIQSGLIATAHYDNHVRICSTG